MRPAPALVRDPGSHDEDGAPQKKPKKNQKSHNNGDAAATLQKADLLWSKVFGATTKQKSSEQPARSMEPASSSWEPQSGGVAAGSSSADLEPAEHGVALRPTACAEFAELEKVAAAMILDPLQEVEEVDNQQEVQRQVPAAAASRAGRPLRLIGVCGFDVAPMRGQGSKCYFCQAAIPKNTVRFDYQFSATGKISRYIHPECCTSIPEQGRENSLEFLRRHVNSDIASEQVQGAIRVLSSM